MVQLITLPLDVLLELVGQYVALCEDLRHQGYLRKPTCKYLWALSQTCKYMHDICSNWIFSSYRLLFRVTKVRAKYSPSLTLYPPSTAGNGCRTGMVEWDERLMLERIAHFATKARFVRELCIEDYGYGEDVPTFPSSAQAYLAETLKKSTIRLQVVRFKGEGCNVGRLSLTLWDALRHADVKEMSLEGVLPPENAACMPCVENLSLEWRERSAAFLQLLDPLRLDLHYINPHHDFGDWPPLFKPTSRTLREITVTYALPNVQTGVLFDLSNVPDASFNLTFRICCQFRFQIPALWQELKLVAQAAFAEGLDCYEVFRSPTSDLVVSRSSAHRQGGLEEMGFEFVPSEEAGVEERVDRSDLEALM
ncbi:hypothetical protein BC835DRAFT_1413331 [Cytidiella melzeri]|nr:hypothetical protein BC835DRAFT_1413331 [Cytidiella melzeri]